MPWLWSSSISLSLRCFTQDTKRPRCELRFGDSHQLLVGCCSGLICVVHFCTTQAANCQVAGIQCKTFVWLILKTLMTFPNLSSRPVCSIKQKNAALAGFIRTHQCSVLFSRWRDFYFFLFLEFLSCDQTVPHLKIKMKMHFGSVTVLHCRIVIFLFPVTCGKYLKLSLKFGLTFFEPTLVSLQVQSLQRWCWLKRQAHECCSSSDLVLR